MKTGNGIKQLGLASILAYHLLPGIPILLIGILFAHPGWGFGLPIFLALMLAILFGLVPVQLGILAVIARREGKKIRDIIGFREKIPVGKILLWSIPGFFLAGMVFTLVGNIEPPLWTIFDWVPEWFRVDRFSIEAMSKGMLYLTLILGFILNGLLGPFVEELYFRGFLLPRMTKLGCWAPLVNGVLFSVYHFWTPWENITRILAVTPYHYTVWYKKNIVIGIVVHLSLNTVSMIGMAVAVLWT